MMLATDDRIVIRKMTDTPTDYVLMAKWLSDPAVLEFYEGRDKPFDLKQVKAKFGSRAMGKDRVVPCIFEINGIAAGYVQFYPHDDEAMAEYELEAGLTAFGIDMFIGNTALWGRGIGPRVLRALARYLVRERGATVITLDPHASNERAIRAYEKAGFAKHKMLPAHELHEGEWRDCWLMVWRLSHATLAEPGFQPD
ncbi:MAG: acetyltransferase [Chloroflexi bacterium]|nr:acetyltransferase [Chloroflexota bacterium]